MITIKTIPSKYFFSGDIKLSGGKESQVDLDTLTKTQLLDIIEAEITRVLVALGVKEVKPFYSNFGKLSISQRMSPTLSSVGNGADKSNMVEQKKTVSALKKLILNLFVENQDVPAWGWVEPKAIHLMDFLLDIDPSSMLLFVYKIASLFFNSNYIQNFNTFDINQ